MTNIIDEKPPHMSIEGFRPLIAGNWKMHGLREDLAILKEVASSIATAKSVDMVVFPPTTLLASARHLTSTSTLKLGGQDCSSEPEGAYTGEISARMLFDAGAEFVLVGHSERRQRHGETDTLIRQKAIQAITVQLHPVICIGETRQERADGKTFEILSSQIEEAIPRTVAASSFTIAYEPLWAIGSGQRAVDRDIEDAHRHIRGELRNHWGIAADRIRILYGGSVKPENCGAILGNEDVDGLLVGGASLDAKQFLSIFAHAAASRRRAK